MKIFFFLTFFFCLSFSNASGEDEIVPLDEAPPLDAIRYEVSISGEMESRLRQVLTQISDTVALKGRPPMTMAQLKRRVRGDVDEFRQALRSFGFYAPEIEFTVDQDSVPVKIEFQVDPGPPFLIKEVKITSICPDLDPEVTMPEPLDLDLEIGTRIQSANVVDAASQIIRHFRARGYPFPIVEISEVIIDHRERTASIYFTLDPGPKALFGRTEADGLDRVRSEYIYERIPWKEGDEFKAPLISDFRRKLTAGGLFSLVEVNHPDELDEEGGLPIKVRVVERKPRTIRAGLGYLTNIGPELKLGWVHRNLRGMGETLEFDLTASDVFSALEGRYTVPTFWRPDHRLITKGSLVREDQDAYKSQSAAVSTMIERRFTDRFSAAAGVGYRVGRVEQFKEKTDVGLIFFPTDITWDGRDDVLNPGTGLSFNAKVIPFVDTLDSKSRFVKTYTSLNTYLELLSDKRIVLANRVALGTINAQSKSHVPPDERFYAGGGGSVRGFSYQSAGELEDGKPTGGMSLAEINSEIRLKLSRRSGVVAFVDGGRAFETSYPDFQEKLYWGWGIGYRFFTDFGPIRADIAFPINRRKGQDDSFQVYVSIGQAF